VPARKPRI